MRPLRKDMQIVFQDPYGSLSPRLSVAEIVEEGLLVQKPRPQPDASGARSSRARCTMSASIPRPWTAIRTSSPAASASASRLRARWRSSRKFVVLDEPTSALDMSVQAQIVELLRDLQKRRNLAYMFISHDLKVVARAGQQSSSCGTARSSRQGSAAEHFRAPQTDYTRALFAAAFNLETAGVGHRPRNDSRMSERMHSHAHHDNHHSHAHHDGAHHGPHHGHGHSHAPEPGHGRAFAIGIVLNLGFVAVEAGYGVLAGSMALLSDAGHNLSDVLGLAIAWGAALLARRGRTERFTYGLRSGSILAALLNALLLLVAVGGIAWEAVRRLLNPPRWPLRQSWSWPQSVSW